MSEKSWFINPLSHTGEDQCTLENWEFIEVGGGGRCMDLGRRVETVNYSVLVILLQ
jgi:hypothetical protein